MSLCGRWATARCQLRITSTTSSKITCSWYARLRKTFPGETDHFQVQFARATALGAYKSSSLTDIGRSVQQVVTLQEEIKLHIDFCKEQGLSVEDIESQEEDQATTAYTRYVLDIGQSQDWLALQVALLPCLIGYGMIAKRLFDDTNTLREGRYWTWIQQYVDEPYVEAMARGSALIEEHAGKQSVARIDELAQIFIHATTVGAHLLSAITS